METGVLDTIELFHAPKDRLRMTWGDRSWHTVKPVWAAPLSQPNKNLSLMDEKGHEIAFVSDLKSLKIDSREAVVREVRLRYLTSIVNNIVAARQEYGATYWTVDTDRGQREFVTQSLQENAVWLSPEHLLLIDVDGNRFEIMDVEALDAKSRQIVSAIL